MFSFSRHQERAGRALASAIQAVIERLEGRRMLTTSFAYDNELFTITADGNAQEIEVYAYGWGVQVKYRENGGDWQYHTETDPVAELLAECGGGADKLTMFVSISSTLRGGDGADTLNGSSGTEVFEGGAGDDLISGGAGDDYIYGGLGSDTLDGGDDNDHIYGDLADTLTSGGADPILGGNGNDIAYGGYGNDYLSGGLGDDYLEGDNDNGSGVVGNDTIYGDAGHDYLVGSDGVDYIYARDLTTDTVLPGMGEDVVDKDPYDTLYDPDA